MSILTNKLQLSLISISLGITQIGLSAAQPSTAIGGGYSSDTQSPTGYFCLKAISPTYKWSPSTAQISVGKAMDRESFLKELDVSATASAGIGPFKASASADYADISQQDAFSLDYYYNATYAPLSITLPRQYFAEQALSDFGLTAYKNAATFRLTCGDQFLQSETLGAELFVTLKINFDSKSDKKTFNTKFSAGFASFGVSGDTKSDIEKSNINGTLSIYAYQTGGTPGELANIFGKDTGGDYAVLQCSLKDLTACTAVMSQIQDYAGTLPKQMLWDDTAKHFTAGSGARLYKSDNDNIDYKSLGLQPTSTILTPEQEAARTDIDTVLATDIRQYAFVSSLLNTPYSIFYTKNDKENLDQIQTQLAELLGLLKDPSNGGLNCYLHPDHCVSLQTTVDALQSKLDLSPLEQFKSGFISTYTASGLHEQLVPLGSHNYVLLAENTDPRLFHMFDVAGFAQVNPRQDGVDIIIANNQGQGDSQHVQGGFLKELAPGAETYTGTIDDNRKAFTRAFTLKMIENPIADIYDTGETK